MPFVDWNTAPEPFPATAATKYLYNQVEQKAQNGNPLKRQRQIGNLSSFTPSGQKLCGTFNSAKGCPDETHHIGRWPCLFRDRPWSTSTPFIGNLPPHSYGVRGQKSFSRTTFWLRKLDSVHCAKHPAWLERGNLLQVPGANIPWIGCCHQLAVWLRLCSVCLIGSRQSRHRVNNHSDDG